MSLVEEWTAFFREHLPEATDDEVRELAEASVEYVHEGHMIIQQAIIEDGVRHQATADFLNSLPRDLD